MPVSVGDKVKIMGGPFGRGKEVMISLYERIDDDTCNSQFYLDDGSPVSFQIKAERGKRAKVNEEIPIYNVEGEPVKGRENEEYNIIMKNRVGEVIKSGGGLKKKSRKRKSKRRKSKKKKSKKKKSKTRRRRR